jgi:uracil-DNA glycosylase
MAKQAENLEPLAEIVESIAELMSHFKKVHRGISISPESLELLAKGRGGPFELAAEPKTKPKAESKPLPSVQGVDCQSLDQVSQWLGECTRCALHEKRNKIVFGIGNPNAELMFVGEGPGRDEDMQGEPFVGAAGQMLTRMIEGGYKKTRQDVYIANVVKCRPPGNRDPQPVEVTACSPFLAEQIRIINPKVICTLGRVATQALLDTAEPISKLRGNWQEYRGIKVMPTFHPAALLRNPDYKRPAWEDIKFILKELGW